MSIPENFPVAGDALVIIELANDVARLEREAARLRASLAAAQSRVAALEATVRAFEMANGQCHRQRDALAEQAENMEGEVDRQRCVAEAQGHGEALAYLDDLVSRMRQIRALASPPPHAPKEEA